MKNIAKPTSIAIIILVFGYSCSIEQKVLTKKINIIVIDDVNNEPIDSAHVTLKPFIDASDINKNTKYTDSLGQSIFIFNLKPGTKYEISAGKKGYWLSLMEDSLNTSRSSVKITESTEDNITLYLTSDSMKRINFWKKTAIRYDIDTLIKVLKFDKYDTLRVVGLPLLEWEDIPRLLEIADDKTLIHSFPTNLLSSHIQKDCYLGIIAILLIESIRITEERRLVFPNDKLPSLNPVLKITSNSQLTLTEIEKMELAHKEYTDWWNRVKQLDKKVASKINPLEGADINW